MNSLLRPGLVSACAIASFLASVPVLAQYYDQSRNLNKMLNAVDNPAGWSRTPVSGEPTSRSGAGVGGYSRNPSTISRTFMNQGLQPWAGQHNALPPMPAQQTSWAQMPAQGAPGGGAMFNRQQLLKALLGGGGGAAAPQGYDSSASGNAYSNWQTAENQQTRAHNFSQQARYGTNSWNRKNYASQARYAANAARAASDRAYQASLNGDESARNYAAKARAAANRAEADANRADYNANIKN